ncbi:MAG: hypothetical protein G01um10147_797 [Microgenomates group bacterium Gr01-1014_7]|nr:MAG: hypothetical protein G01um10147_797 [Microgenomates group bacterium Gr01-1014_7]
MKKMTEEVKNLKKQLARVKDRERKRVKFGYTNTKTNGTYGEFLVLDMLEGSKLKRKPTYDIKAADGAKVEVKTSCFHADRKAWEFQLKEKQQRADVLTLICLNQENKLGRRYDIPPKELGMQNLWLCEGTDRFEAYRVI